MSGKGETVETIFERYARDNGWELLDETLPEDEWLFGLPTWRITANKATKEISVTWFGISSRRRAYIRAYGGMRVADAGLDAYFRAVRRRTRRSRWHMCRPKRAGGAYWALCGKVIRSADTADDFKDVRDQHRCKRCVRRWDREYLALLRPILDASDADWEGDASRYRAGLSRDWLG